MPRLNVSRQRRAPVRKRSHVTARATGTPGTPAIARQQPGATLSRLRLFVRPSLPTPRKTGMLRRPQPSTRQKACFAAMSLRECESGGWCPPLRDRKATPCRGRGRWRNSIKAGCLSPSYRQAQCEIETGPAACAPLVGGWGAAGPASIHCGGRWGGGGRFSSLPSRPARSGLQAKRPPGKVVCHLRSLNIRCTLSPCCADTSRNGHAYSCSSWPRTCRCCRGCTRRGFSRKPVCCGIKGLAPE